MTLQDYVAALRSHWIIILLLTLLGGGAAYGYSQTIDPTYRAQAEVMILPARGENTSELVQGSNYVQGLVQSYTLLITSPTVLEPVIDKLELDATPAALKRRLSVNVPLETVGVQIGVTDTDPKRAQLIVNEVAAQFSLAVQEVSPKNAVGESSINVVTIATARVPTSQVAPNTKMNMLIGGGIGVVLGVVFALFRTRLATRMVNSGNIEAHTEVALLGEISLTDDGLTVPRIISTHPRGHIAESVRQIAASLKFVNLDRSRRVIMVTSGLAMEGKSSASLALALTLAEAGNSVLYLEADLRRPSASHFTQLEASVGLTSVLLGEVSLAGAVQAWGQQKLDVLTCGMTPPNPGQLLSSGELQGVIDEARESYDYVIVDTAPVLSVSDAMWLAPMVDGILFVVRENRTKSEDMRRALETLETSQTPLMGIVIDGVKGKAKSPYYVEEGALRSSDS